MNYYIHERGTTSGGTVYEPMLPGQDPDAAQTTPAFNTRDGAELWIATSYGTMVTATYTDPTTGWVQRVEVLEVLSDAALIRNTEDVTAQVPVTALSEPRRMQADNREYLPRTTLAGTR